MQYHPQKTAGSGWRGRKKKPAGILDLLGLAVGCIGMRPVDFCRCYVEEFEAICRAWSEMREGDSRADWERVRILASITVSPHVKGPVHPKELLPMPWDSESRMEPAELPRLTAEEQLARGRDFARSLGYKV